MTIAVDLGRKATKPTNQPLYNATVCPLPQIDVKLNFCCNEFKFKLNWQGCANTIDVKNFAVIKNVAVKSFHCIAGL